MRVVRAVAVGVVAALGAATASEVPPQPAQFVPTGVERVGALKSRTAAIDGRGGDADVDIAIVDGGVGPHVDLNVVGGVDCADGDGYDDRHKYGHGTLVAGLAAARDNAIGAVGVAPGARIWSVRVLNPDGSGSLQNLLCGLEWIRDNAGRIDVANLSLSFPGTGGSLCGAGIDLLHQAICDVVDAGVTVVTGAGHGFHDADGTLPAAYPEAIAVSGLADADGKPGGRGKFDRCTPTAVDDTLVDFSNYGRSVDVAAPGMCIRSTALNDGYVEVLGLSFASALVAGGAALLRVAHPSWTPREVRTEILRTAEPGPLAGDPDDYAEGVLNVSGF